MAVKEMFFAIEQLEKKSHIYPRYLCGPVSLSVVLPPATPLPLQFYEEADNAGGLYYEELLAVLTWFKDRDIIDFAQDRVDKNNSAQKSADLRTFFKYPFAIGALILEDGHVSAATPFDVDNFIMVYSTKFPKIKKPDTIEMSLNRIIKNPVTYPDYWNIIRVTRGSNWNVATVLPKTFGSPQTHTSTIHNPLYSPPRRNFYDTPALQSPTPSRSFYMEVGE